MYGWNKPIKNENQIIVRSKQPIQSLLTFSHSAGEKNIPQRVLLSFFSVFIALQSAQMPSKVILIVIEFMFLGINMFWALLRLILALAARAKMSLSQAQNIFMPANINSIVIL